MLSFEVSTRASRGDRRLRVSNIFKHIKQVTVFSFNTLLQLTKIIFRAASTFKLLSSHALLRDCSKLYEALLRYQELKAVESSQIGALRNPQHPWAFHPRRSRCCSWSESHEPCHQIALILSFLLFRFVRIVRIIWINDWVI